MRSRSRPFTVLATNPNADFYGASRMLLEAVDGFLARGWRVVVCIPDGPLVAEIESRGAEVRFAPSPVLRRTSLTPKGLLALVGLTLRSIWGNVALIRSVRPDVMYVNTIIQPLWLVLGRLLRTPVVCHVHEAESTLPAIVRKALAAPLWFARRIIVNSTFCEGVFVDAWPRLKPRYDIVYNGVGGPPSLTPPRAEITAPLRLLYIGRLSERKGVQDAVDALGLLDRDGVVAQLDLVGDVFPGYEAVVEDIHRRAADAGTTDRMHLHGFDTDVWPYLAAADILLVPSRLEETFGNVAVEGLRAARPIVVARTSGLIEAADGFGAAVGFPPGDVAALTNAIRDIVEHWSDYRDRALADSTHAADQFSLERYRAAMAAVIEHAAPGSPS